MAKAMERFYGSWHLAREVSTGARFEGEAVITETPFGAIYREDGMLAMDGQTPIRATRHLRWHREEDAIAVYFEDGRFFHRFNPDADAPEARHLCDPDIYDVVYCFAKWPSWKSTWTVQGPRKSYTMISRYSR
ncbi:DUF6314 family protein [Paracoccaceae bacterium GXU_MW_L88]